MEHLKKYFVYTSIPFALTAFALYLLDTHQYYHVVLKTWVFCMALLGSYALIIYLRK